MKSISTVTVGSCLTLKHVGLSVTSSGLLFTLARDNLVLALDTVANYKLAFPIARALGCYG